MQHIKCRVVLQIFYGILRSIYRLLFFLCLISFLARGVPGLWSHGSKLQELQAMGAVIFQVPAGQAPNVYTVQYSCYLGRPACFQFTMLFGIYACNNSKLILTSKEIKCLANMNKPSQGD